MTKESPAHRAALSEEDYHKLTGFDGDWRDTWWNDEFLSMMAKQWRLDQVQTVLDVGCGVGHWGQRLMRHLSPTTTLYGVLHGPRPEPQNASRGICLSVTFSVW